MNWIRIELAQDSRRPSPPLCVEVCGLAPISLRSVRRATNTVRHGRSKQT